MSPLLFNLRSAGRPPCSLCGAAPPLTGGELCAECDVAYQRYLEEERTDAEE